MFSPKAYARSYTGLITQRNWHIPHTRSASFFIARAGGEGGEDGEAHEVMTHEHSAQVS